MLIKDESMRHRVISRLMLFTVKTATCWLWEGTTDDSGNPIFDGESVRRLLYELETRDVIMPDEFAMPSCRNRDCVKPGHVELVGRTEALEWY